MHKRLRSLRDGKGLSQKDAATKLGIKASSLSHFESGLRVPSFPNLVKLSDFHGVSVDYLMGRPEIPDTASSDVSELFASVPYLHPDDFKALFSLAKYLSKSKHRVESLA